MKRRILQYVLMNSFLHLQRSISYIWTSSLASFHCSNTCVFAGILHSYINMIFTYQDGSTWPTQGSVSPQNLQINSGLPVPRLSVHTEKSLFNIVQPTGNSTTRFTLLQYLINDNQIFPEIPKSLETMHSASRVFFSQMCSHSWIKCMNFDIVLQPTEDL